MEQFSNILLLVGRYLVEQGKVICKLADEIIALFLAH